MKCEKAGMLQFNFDIINAIKIEITHACRSIASSDLITFDAKNDRFHRIIDII